MTDVDFVKKIGPIVATMHSTLVVAAGQRVSGRKIVRSVNRIIEFIDALETIRDQYCAKPELPGLAALIEASHRNPMRGRIPNKHGAGRR